MRPPEREAWQRGPVAGSPPLLQPVAHALIQARDEAAAVAAGLDDAALAARPGGVASAAFHLRHMTGVIDRLFTYARGEALTDAQLEHLAHEGDPPPSHGASALAAALGAQVERALQQLADTDEATLTAPRTIGRAAIPTTHVGLLVHAAEHVQRHLGQLLVTARVAAAAQDGA